MRASSAVSKIRAVFCCWAFAAAFACGPPARAPADASPRTADDLAERYVRLAFALDALDPLFLDLVFVSAPAGLRGSDGSPALSLAEIAERAGRLAEAAGGIARTEDEFRVRRITASIRALGFRARALFGERRTVREELREVFGLDWTEPALALERLHFRVDRALPGVGPLRVRVRRHYERAGAPSESASSSLAEALARCRARMLPEPAPLALEPLRLAWVPPAAALRLPTGPAPFYRYEGAGRGVLRLPAGLAFRPGEFDRLACHEGVPGHHLQAVAADQHFRATGWPELGIIPLYGPRTAVFEGLAATFERLAPADAADEALRDFEPVVTGVLARYLDGELGRLEALRALDFEALVPDPHVLLDHADRFGGYALVRPSADPVFRAALETLLDPGLSRDDRFRTTLRVIREAMSPRELLEVLGR